MERLKQETCGRCQRCIRHLLEKRCIEEVSIIFGRKLCRHEDSLCLVITTAELEASATAATTKSTDFECKIEGDVNIERQAELCCIGSKDPNKAGIY